MSRSMMRWSARCRSSRRIKAQGIFIEPSASSCSTPKGEMLLQQRSADKVTFPSVWANACCSHPLHSPEEMEESGAMGVKRAAVRKLEQELGIDPSSISTDDMIFMSKMRYAARMNNEWIEREIDHILVMCADVDIAPNPNEVANTMWVSQEEMEAMLLEERPADEAIAPWFRCIAARIMHPRGGRSTTTNKPSGNSPMKKFTTWVTSRTCYQMRWEPIC